MTHIKGKSLFVALTSFVFTAMFLVFVLSSTPAFATATDSDIAEMEDAVDGIMNYPVHIEGENLEYAHLWFKQILGGFIFAPWHYMGIDNGAYDPDDQTVLSQALGFTNVLAIIICLVIAYYIIVGGAINTASQGEALGKSWDGPWLAIRTSVGFLMLVPMKALGGMTLSFSQVAVIWLIMIGSNAASILWTMVGESIIEGTHIVRPNIQVGMNDVVDMSKIMMCTDFLLRTQTYGAAEPDSDDESSGGGPRSGIMSRNASEATDDQKRLYRIKYADGNLKTAEAPYSSDLGSHYWDFESTQIEGLADREPDNPALYIEFGNGGRCGKIEFASRSSFTLDTSGFEGDGGENRIEATNYKEEALLAGAVAYATVVEEVINDLLPLVNILQDSENSDSGDLKRIVEELNTPASGLKSETEEILDDSYEIFKQVAEKYDGELIDVIYSETTGSDAVVDKMREEITYGGWASAGIWFMELSTIPSLPYQVISPVRDTINMSTDSLCTFHYFSSNCADMEEAMGAMTSLMASNFSERADQNDEPFALPSDKVSGGCSGSDCGSISDISDRYSVTVSANILSFLGGRSDNQNPLKDPQSLSSPFLFLSEVGNTMNQAAHFMIGGAIAVNALKDTKQDVKDALQKTIGGVVSGWTGGRAISEIFFGLPFNLVKYTAVAAATGLVMAAMMAFTSGFVLAYVIPFLPITTWIMMMAGYMLTVVEAIAAAPLAIVLLFTPEGSGIAGSRFERALNLVTMAILRPSFMILGLISAITVSFVAFTMMNLFFFQAAEHVLQGSLFDAIAIMLLYTGTAYQLVKMMVENMHTLPDRLGEWFAGGMSRQFGESRVGDSAAQSMGQMNSGMQKMPQQMASMQKSMSEMSDKIDKKSG